jgi:NADH-quinone oxidoreductase subunit N
MITVKDLVPVLPEVFLSGFAILIMIVDPFVPASGKKGLGWFSLLGVAASGGSFIWSSFPPGLGFGKSLAGDSFSVFFIFLFLLIAALTLLGSMDYLVRDNLHQGEYYALILFDTVGMCFMASSTDLILVFIGLEISSISSYVLAGFKRHDPLSNESSLKYFLLGSFATAFFLYGIAFVYGLEGSTNLLDLGAAFAQADQWTSPAKVALVLMFIGLAFKVSTVPFQIWTPDVYQGAPAPVTAFLSTGPKAAAFAVLLRITLGVWGSAGPAAFWLIWISAVLTMSVGNLAALRQTNLKRLLAYSAIAHAGYLLVGVAAGMKLSFSPEKAEGSASVLFYLGAYALMNVGAFLIIAHLAGTGEKRTLLEDFTGLGRERPGIAACLTVFMLSLAGIPMTAGFFAKFYVFRAAVHAHLIGLTIIAVLNGVISVYYYLAVVVTMYMREGKPEASTAPLPWPLLAALSASVIGIFYLGLYPNHFLVLANMSAAPLP